MTSCSCTAVSQRKKAREPGIEERETTLEGSDDGRDDNGLCTLARLCILVQRREDKEVEAERVQDKEVAGEAVREDDGREREEDLLERVERVHRAPSFLQR